MGSVLNKESKETCFIIFGVHLLAHLNRFLKRNKRKTLIKKRKGPEQKKNKVAGSYLRNLHGRLPLRL
jgi:hypothetical protein